MAKLNQLLLSDQESPRESIPIEHDAVDANGTPTILTYDFDMPKAFARNMIFQCVARRKSLIITDPKSELYESMSAYLENENYIVKMFNLVNPENSDAWNCLMEISGQETMARVLSDVII